MTLVTADRLDCGRRYAYDTALVYDFIPYCWENVMARSFIFVSVGFVSLMALALCTTTWAQPGPGSGPEPRTRHIGGPSSVLPLMYMYVPGTPTVQKELNLTEDQQAKIKEVTDKAQTTMRDLFASFLYLSEEGRQARMEEAHKKMEAQAEETKKAIEGILLPKQLERLKGIVLQVAGVSALREKEVQQDINLSDDQVTKMKAVSDDSIKKVDELFSEPADPQTIRLKMLELRKDYEKQVMSVLTADQKALLEKLKGTKLEIPSTELRALRTPNSPAE
jgi:hypothetical protein